MLAASGGVFVYLTGAMHSTAVGPEMFIQLTYIRSISAGRHPLGDACQWMQSFVLQPEFWTAKNTELVVCLLHR